jgi:hypothetical protein
MNMRNNWMLTFFLYYFCCHLFLYHMYSPVPVSWWALTVTSKSHAPVARPLPSVILAILCGLPSNYSMSRHLYGLPSSICMFYWCATLLLDETRMSGSTLPYCASLVPISRHCCCCWAVGFLYSSPLPIPSSSPSAYLFELPLLPVHRLFGRLSHFLCYYPQFAGCTL